MVELEYEDTLTGLYQVCPLCFGTLHLRPMPDPSIGERHWYCKCGTEWDAAELIEAQKYEEVEG